MNINRNNYEEFFVLYIDNELKAAERAAVENFVDQNPDLKTELEMLQQTIMLSDNNEVFINKELLFRKESEAATGFINEVNCEELFVLYADNELNNTENGLVEEFIYSHPQHQENFELIQQIKFQPEKHIVFPDKSILYRSENDHKVVPMFVRMRTWKMVAAAAVLLMIGGTVWYALNNSGGNGITTLAGNEPAPVKITPARPSSEPGAGKAPSTAQTMEASVNNNDTKAVDQKSAGTESAVASATVSSPGITSSAENQKEKSNNQANDNLAVIKKQSSTRPASKADAAINELISKTNQSTDKSFAQADTKKDKDQSNIIVKPNVQQQKDSNKDEMLAVVPEKQNNDNSVAIGPVQLKSDNVFAKMVNENDEEFEQSDKKNKMRGFFRKVTRVFDKATSREPAEERKGVRIASFSIGLK